MGNQVNTYGNKIFLGRVEELKQFRVALKEVKNNQIADETPFIFLLYGNGGTGKTTLAQKFHSIAVNEGEFSDSFQFLSID